MKNLLFLLMAVCTGITTLPAQQLKADYSIGGWKFPAERPPLRIMHHFSGDTLYITTPGQFHPGVIGISTYSESLDNTISIPSGKKLIIHGSGNLTIEDYFITGRE